ncbi:MAG: DoxX family protein [Planctomycetes bacterium]|nr:DoxX family protein [Planctomycetota bacterium]MCH9727053.1 DoxX family protein [Planctomycetota bacterium]MCH9774996.1 DoxX family protein [Planctomycetota bacterium]
MIETTDSLLAHVSYIVDPEKLKALAGTDWEFLLSPLYDSFYLTLIIVTLVVVVGCFMTGELVRPLRDSCRSLHNRLLGYREFIPLVLRVSLGVSLIVAGTKQAIYLPNVPGDAVSTLEVVIGFFLLVGFMVRLGGLSALAIYFYGLSNSHYLLGTMESAAAAVLVLAYGGERPSADHLLNFDLLGTLLKTFWKKLQENTGLILRLSLGSTLIWLAVTEKAFNPRVSEAVVIDFNLENVIPVSSAMWVFSVGMIEFAVGLVLILGFFTRTFSIIAFLVLTLSFFYFKEEVAGHVTFFGSLLVLMVTGAGRFSIDSYITKQTRQASGTEEPYVLES